MTAAAGTAAVSLALVCAVALSGVSIRAVRGNPRAADAVPRIALVMLAAAVLAMVVLEFALITDDFSIRYAAEHHARSTPMIYAIVTAWAALEGSIVLWGMVLAAFIYALARTLDDGDRLGLTAVAAAAGVAVFFFGMILTVANPFDPISPVPPDGPGPNPLLQNNPLMAIHPPLLYLGYVGFTIPFAFGIAALALGEAGRQWLTRIRVWTLVAWIFLTAGISVGALWSYQVLGWGGFWGWDPVENASLLPWLVGTAFLHSAIAQSRRGVLSAWNVILIISTFALTILGTFLTRSGVTASVHSFSQSAVGPVLLGFFVVVVIGSLGLFAARAHLVASPPRIERLVSREGAFLANNVLLSVLTFVVLLGTTYPILLEAVTGTQVSVGRPFFDRFAAPLGLALLAAMAIGPLLPYRAANRRLLSDRLRLPVIVALGVGALMVVLGLRTGWVVVTTILALLVFAAAAGEMWRQSADRPGPRLKEMRRLLQGDRGYWGGQLAHVGVAMVIFAIMLSTNLVRQETITIGAGQTVQTVGTALRYDGLKQWTEPNRTTRAADIAMIEDGRTVGRLLPRMNNYPLSRTAIAAPAVRMTITEDLYLALRDLQAEEVTLEVYRYRFMWLLWAGGLVTLAGACWALTGRRGGRRTVAGPAKPQPKAVTVDA